MQIVKALTMGRNPPVTKEDLKQMTRQNAKQLIALKKAGVKLTPKIIGAAKSHTENRFREVIPALANVVNPGARR